MGECVQVGVCGARLVSACVCVMCRGVVRGVKGGVGGRRGEDAAGMVYGVGVSWGVLGCM